MRVLALLVALPFLVGFGSASTPHRDVVLRFEDPDIVEASGLVVRHGLFTTVNDSGDSGRVFTADASGRTVGVTSWSDEPTDDEAIAPLPHGRVLVGDVGDNPGDRDDVTLRVVPVGRFDRTVTPTTYRLTYPDGPADAETLMVQPGTGRILVVTKGFFGGQVLIAPKRLSTTHVNRMRQVGTAIPIATDGAFFPDGEHLVIRDYSRAVVYTYPGLRPIARLPLPRQQQGEGIAIGDDDQVYVSSEGIRSPVLRVALPDDLRAVVLPTVTGGETPVVPPLVPPHTATPAPVTASDHPTWPWYAGGAVLLVTLAASARVMLRRRPRS